MSKLKEAIMEAADWSTQLTDVERTAVPYWQAKENVMNRIHEKYKSDLKEVIHCNIEPTPTESTDTDRMMPKQCYRYTNITDQQVFMNLFSNIQVNFNKVAFKDLEIGQAYTNDPFLTTKKFGTKTGEDEAVISTDEYRIKQKFSLTDPDRWFYPIVFNRKHDPDFDQNNYPYLKIVESAQIQSMNDSKLCIAPAENQKSRYIFYGEDLNMISRTAKDKNIRLLDVNYNNLDIKPVYYKHIKNNDIFFVPGADKNDIANYRVCQKFNKKSQGRNFHCNGYGSINQSKSITDHVVVFKFTLE